MPGIKALAITTGMWSSLRRMVKRTPTHLTGSRSPLVIGQRHLVFLFVHLTSYFQRYYCFSPTVVSAHSVGNNIIGAEQMIR
ncbi:MAG: hypothetical protein KOO62_07905 [candidate division Zixibacteria bacterium]|nr:hypothetical protein [candidate division Zixibacteria bacterium]